MSTIKADGIEAATGTNTDLTLAGKGTGVPDLATGFKVGSVAGVPTASIRDDAVTLAKLAAGTDGELITWDASGDPAAVAVGTVPEVVLGALVVLGRLPGHPRLGIPVAVHGRLAVHPDR